MSAIRLLIHAPTEAALVRARSNARNLLAEVPDAQVELVANAAGVPAALATPDPDTDTLLRLCANSLGKQGLDAPGHLVVVPAAVSHIARRQIEGWQYLRA